MTCIKKEYDTSVPYIDVYVMADLHIGDPNCDIKLIKEKIKEIDENPYAAVILNGDIMNNSVKNSIGNTYGEVLSPMQQLEKAIELFEPVKDKIICITTGNHEERSNAKGDGIELTKILATELGHKEDYAAEGAAVFIKLGRDLSRSQDATHERKIWYSIYVTHGSGGGKKTGSKANALHELAEIIDADIYIHSHTHEPFCSRDQFYRSTPNSGSVNLVEHLFVNTAAALNYGGYGQAKKFRPASKETPIIHLNGSTKKATVTF